MDEKTFEHYRREALEYAKRAQPAPFPDDGAAFLASHTGRGSLRVQVSSGGGSYPVEGAAVEVFRQTESARRVYFRKVTDISGIADNMILPALPKQNSLRSETADSSSTEYGVTVFHPAYFPGKSHTVAIYDGIETLLPVELIPAARS